MRHGLASFEGRFPLFQVMPAHVDAVIAHHWENSQNYLYYEALHGGFPLVHNSHLLGDCGYRYHGFDCEEGGQRAAAAPSQSTMPTCRLTARARRNFLARLDPETEANVRTYTGAIEALYHPPMRMHSPAAWPSSSALAWRMAAQCASRRARRRAAAPQDKLSAAAGQRRHQALPAGHHRACPRLSLQGSRAHDLLLDWDRKRPDGGPIFALLGIEYPNAGVAASITAMPEADGSCTVAAERISVAPFTCASIAQQELARLPDDEAAADLRGVRRPEGAQLVGLADRLAAGLPGHPALRRVFVEGPGGTRAPTGAGQALTVHCAFKVLLKNSTTAALKDWWNAARSKLGALAQMTGASAWSALLQGTRKS